jgi:hypothetical protein
MRPWKARTFAASAPRSISSQVTVPGGKGQDLKKRLELFGKYTTILLPRVIAEYRTLRLQMLQVEVQKLWQECGEKVKAYGFLLATGFLVAIWLAQREGRRQGQDPESIADLSFWILVSSLVGSRVYFILVNWSDYFGPNAWVSTTISMG